MYCMFYCVQYTYTYILYSYIHIYGSYTVIHTRIIYVNAMLQWLCITSTESGFIIIIGPTEVIISYIRTYI